MALQINLLSTNENNHLNHDFPQAYVRINKFGGSKNNITYKNAEEFVYKINCLIIENDILKEKIKVLEKNRI